MTDGTASVSPGLPCQAHPLTPHVFYIAIGTVHTGTYVFVMALHTALENTALVNAALKKTPLENTALEEEKNCGGGEGAAILPPHSSEMGNSYSLQCSLHCIGIGKDKERAGVEPYRATNAVNGVPH